MWGGNKRTKDTIHTVLYSGGIERWLAGQIRPARELETTAREDTEVINYFVANTYEIFLNVLFKK